MVDGVSHTLNSPLRTQGAAVAAVCDRRNWAQIRTFSGAHRAPLQFLNGLLSVRRLHFQIKTLAGIFPGPFWFLELFDLALGLQPILNLVPRLLATFQIEFVGTLLDRLVHSVTGCLAAFGLFVDWSRVHNSDSQPRRFSWQWGSVPTGHATRSAGFPACGFGDIPVPRFKKNLPPQTKNFPTLPTERSAGFFIFYANHLMRSRKRIAGDHVAILSASGLDPVRRCFSQQVRDVRCAFPVRPRAKACRRGIAACKKNR